MDIVIRSDAQGVTKDDDFDYSYISGKNQLDFVTDNVTTSTYSEDIKHLQTTGNYQYDALGQLVKDVDERIDTMVWSVTGKVQRIIRNSDEGNDMEFRYGPMDQRVVKITKARVGGSLLPQEDWDYTYYVRDAQGNPIAIYERSFEEINTNMYEDKFALTEVGLYGSKRLGQDKNYIEKISAFNASTTSISVPGGITETVFDTTTLEITGVASYTTTNDSTISEVDLSAYGREMGLKEYELSNHLGNVLQVISDRKFSYDGNTNDTADYYFPDILVCNDYYPFGSLMPGRNANTPNYRYGFQGQEKDDEVKGPGNSVNYAFRMHDPRLGRFFAVDPLTKKYPHYSPYQFSGNKVIHMVELEGLEEKSTPDKEKKEEALPENIPMPEVPEVIGMPLRKPEQPESGTGTEKYTSSELTDKYLKNFQILIETTNRLMTEPNFTPGWLYDGAIIDPEHIPTDMVKAANSLLYNNWDPDSGGLLIDEFPDETRVREPGRIVLKSITGYLSIPGHVSDEVEIKIVNAEVYNVQTTNTNSFNFIYSRDGAQLGYPMVSDPSGLEGYFIITHFEFVIVPQF